MYCGNSAIPFRHTVYWYLLIQGDQSSDSVLGVGTPVRHSATRGVFYYNNLTSVEPQSFESDDLELGLTRRHNVRAHVNTNLDGPPTDPINVPLNRDSLYGEPQFLCTGKIACFIYFVCMFHSRSWSFQ